MLLLLFNILRYINVAECGCTPYILITVYSTVRIYHSLFIWSIVDVYSVFPVWEYVCAQCMRFSRAVVLKVCPWTSASGIAWKLMGNAGPTQTLNQKLRG